MSPEFQSDASVHVSKLVVENQNSTINSATICSNGYN